MGKVSDNNSYYAGLKEAYRGSIKDIDLKNPFVFKQCLLLLKETIDEDNVLRHIYADALLCETLKMLGYEKGVEVFENLKKSY